MNPKVFSRKLSPNAKYVITKMPPEETRLLKILMRISGDLNPQRQLQLQALGCQIHTIAGDVVSAEIPEGALIKAAELDFIDYIEIAQLLYPEAKANQE